MFSTIHVYGTLYKDHRYLTVEGKQIKNKDAILQFLATTLKLEKVQSYIARDIKR